MIRLIDFIQKNSKIYIIVAILLLLNILGFSLFSINEYKLHSDSGGALKKASNSLNFAEKNLKKITKKYKTVKNIQKRIKIFKNKDLKNESYFEKEMTKLIFKALNDNNINFGSLSYGEKTILKGNIKKRPAHIPIKSSYVNFRKLLVKLEQLPFPTMIDKITISSVNSDEISATIDIISYYRRWLWKYPIEKKA